MRNINTPNPAWRRALADWSIQDSEAASKLGWNIFASAPNPLPGDDDPPFVVWRDDKVGILGSDEEAYALLRKLVSENDNLAAKARRFLEIHSPSELRRVFYP